MSPFKGGVPGVIEILQLLDSVSQKRLLADLAKKDPELAKKIEAQLFTFEDFTRLPGGDIQALLREVPQPLLVLALRKATDALKNHFFSNMTVRAANALREEIAASPPRRTSEVQKAQSEIIEIARRLEGEGRILLRPR